MIAGRKPSAAIGNACLLTLIALSLVSCGAQTMSRAAGASQASAPASCPATHAPEPPFVPPAAYRSTPAGGQFWYGTPALWTALPTTGAWPNLPFDANGFTQKILWWHDGYDWRAEPVPNLVVSGTKVDGPSKALVSSAGSNAFASDIGSAMVVVVSMPTAGCWKITGAYKESQLSFVVTIPE
jgi:hypothetical protein